MIEITEGDIIKSGRNTNSKTPRSTEPPPGQCPGGGKAYQEYHKGELMFVLVSDATGHIWAGNKDMSSSTDKQMVLTNAYRLLGEYYISAAELSTFNTLNYRKTDQISYVELPGYEYAVTCSQELEDEIKKC